MKKIFFLLSLAAIMVAVNFSCEKKHKKEVIVLTHADSLEIIRKDSVKLAEKKANEIRLSEEQKQWAKDNPRAAKIKKKHQEWSNSDCEDLSNHKIWVGMTYEMVVCLRGKPNSANPSNNGGKTHWQYCWDDFTPSCFYDDNNDGIMDGYN